MDEINGCIGCVVVVLVYAIIGLVIVAGLSVLF